MKLKTFGSVSQGKLVIYNRSEFLDILKTWKDCAVELTLQSKTKGRSSPQNRYYWGCVLPIIKEALREQHGLIYDSEDLHDFLKIKFNSIEIVNEDEVVEKLPVSTTALNTAEFEAFLENIRIWGNDFLNIIIPLPNEQAELFSKNSVENHQHRQYNPNQNQIAMHNLTNQSI